MRKDTRLRPVGQVFVNLGRFVGGHASSDGENDVGPNDIRPECKVLGSRNPNGVVVKDGPVDEASV